MKLVGTTRWQIFAIDRKIFYFAGACGGTLACSTCHCIFNEEDFARLNFEDDLTEEEIDMLDLAYGVTDRYVNALFLISY